ncbi:MAG: universal stress protein, partial [Planctomycetota bacterium]
MIGPILIPIETSSLSCRIIDPIRSLLKTHGHKVLLLHVIEGGERKREELKKLTEEARSLLDTLCDQLEDEGAKATGIVDAGDAAEQILDTVEQRRPSLVAMATHGRSGISRLVRGSVTERVMRLCRVPVLTCNPSALDSDDFSFKRVLVPLDGSEVADKILSPVKHLGAAFQYRVTLLKVTAPDKPNAQPAAEALERQREYLERSGLKVEVEDVVGRPGEQILKAAENVDLVAMSTHGRSGVSRWWYGSVTEDVLRHCNTPLLVR